MWHLFNGDYTQQMSATAQKQSVYLHRNETYEVNYSCHPFIIEY